MFTRSEVIVLTHKQTHKQTPSKTSNVLCYATTLGKHTTHTVNQCRLKRPIICHSWDIVQKSAQIVQYNQVWQGILVSHITTVTKRERISNGAHLCWCQRWTWHLAVFM